MSDDKHDEKAKAVAEAAKAFIEAPAAAQLLALFGLLAVGAIMGKSKRKATTKPTPAPQPAAKPEPAPQLLELKPAWVAENDGTVN